ncbi:hypothetical protein EVAR_85433_1 [Eumeta japonica]|uniref:Uncharacterized protein n=1 Tax=Eumeta variegata TaxID=151549 RepID=A0A4C1WJ14_EUMVA|nr:hypothetical protein EVAR_85433_1 [Eumeta japonica]
MVPRLGNHDEPSNVAVASATTALSGLRPSLERRARLEVQDPQSETKTVVLEHSRQSAIKARHGDYDCREKLSKPPIRSARQWNRIGRPMISLSTQQRNGKTQNSFA